jgi:hypothetical protein
MELTLCMEMDEQRQMETRSASDVAQLPRNEGILPREAFWRKEKNRTPKSESRLSLPELESDDAIPKAGGLNPCPWPGRERCDFTCDRSRPFLLSGA